MGHVPATNGYGAMFYVLTGFHALHVLVGLTYLAWLLRARFLIDMDCWSEDKGQPVKPGAIEREIRAKLGPR